MSVYSTITFRVYDVLENEVASLVNEARQSGSYQVSFNPQQIAGNQQLSSGGYFYPLSAGTFVESKKNDLVEVVIKTKEAIRFG